MLSVSKFRTLLSALLVISLLGGIFANATFGFETTAKAVAKDDALHSAALNPTVPEQVPTEKLMIINGAESVDGQQAATDGEIAGAAGSGWKPDVNIVPGSIYTSREEVNPSIATYINASTGAVTLWAAMQSWSGYYSHWFLWIWASNDRGATWWQRGAAEYMSNRSIINPSIAVSPYNGTVFVAVQNAAYGADTNDIQIHVISPVLHGSWSSYSIDSDGDDDRSPQLVSEYSWGASNYLYVSYERYVTSNDRDLCFGRSFDWGKTWSKLVLRGAAGTP